MLDNSLDAILLLRRKGHLLVAPQMLFNDENLIVLRDSNNTIFILDRMSSDYRMVDISVWRST